MRSKHGLIYFVPLCVI